MEKDALVLYDEETHSRWNQLGGIAATGQLQGSTLNQRPSTLTTWKDWFREHPDTSVYVRRLFPYRSRFTAEEIRLATRGNRDDLVVSVEAGTVAKAYFLRTLSPGAIYNELIGDQAILLHLNASGETIRVWGRTVDGKTLTFQSEDARIRDIETGSEWDTGSMIATSGPLLNQKLTPIPFLVAKWASWKKYRPETVLVELNQSKVDAGF